MIEYDEANVKKATSSKHKNSKSGRGSQQKGIVTVIAESTVLEDFTNGALKRDVGGSK